MVCPVYPLAIRKFAAIAMRFSKNRPQQRSTKFSDWHADETVTEGLRSYVLELTFRLQMKRQAVVGADRIPN